MNHFIEALNVYRAIDRVTPGAFSPQEREVAHILRRIDRPGRRRRYLASTIEPSIDGYIDFVYAERQAHSVRNGETPSTNINPESK
jgi:hypothetical protein